jgi:carboxypeptidase Q
MYRTIYRSFILFILLSSRIFAQSTDSAKINHYRDILQRMMATGLESGKAYEMLHELCTTIGPRLSGSPNADKAVQWAKEKMETLGFDRVWLEPVMVPHWVRGPIEEGSIVKTSSREKIPLNICALGGSIATHKQGITAEVVEVKSFEELRALGDQAKGKIIFLNRPMDRKLFSTGQAYGGAVNQRSQGAIEAAKAGGVAALVRSMTTRIDNVPHTGMMNYADTIPKVPSAAISTSDANTLSDMLKKEPHLKVYMKLTCETLPDAESANVIGEIVGTEKPNEVVVVGGHFDSWDKGQGAHDDGTGCMHAVEALRLIKELELKPKRTIRAVLFMNEENGVRGGQAYAAKERPGEIHIAAIESDAGGFTPRGFGVTTDSVRFEKIAQWASVFEMIDAARITRGGGGVDIDPLRRKGVPVLGLRVDGQRYFDYHHSDHDTIDKVNERELELGAIAMAMISYILAEEGLPSVSDNSTR